MPRHLQISGIGWLAGAVVLIGLVIVVFAGGLHGVAVDVTVADDAVVGWLGGLNLPGLVAVMQVLAMLSSWWVLKALSVALLLALLALRRFRHLIVYAIFSGLLSLLTTDVLGAIAQRPRPFGVPIRTSWGGWALPPLELTTLAFLMVVVLYTLVPEGRWRNVGKFAATGLVALAALGRMALGADAPTDVLVGVAIGVTLPLLAFRWFTPSSVFPISYRRGRPPTWTSAVPADWRSARGCRTSSAWSSRRSNHSDWRARAGQPHCGSRSRATHRPTCSPSCTPVVICAPTAGTNSAGSCSTGGWRTRSRSTPSAGWSSRRTTRCR